MSVVDFMFVLSALDLARLQMGSGTARIQAAWGQMRVKLLDSVILNTPVWSLESLRACSRVSRLQLSDNSRKRGELRVSQSFDLIPEWTPTEEDFKRFKHLLRYIKGSLHVKMLLRPPTAVPAEFGREIEIRVYVDASWA